MPQEKVKRKKSPLRRAIIIVASIIFALAVIFAFFMICDAVAHAQVRVLPSYAMDAEGLAAVLEKDRTEWTDDDYDFVYHQSGLTRVYFDSQQTLNRSFVMQCQQDIFYDAVPEHDAANFGSSHDCFPGHYFSMVPLRAGDVIISSSVHTFGWLNGHAAIVTVGGSPSTARTLQAITIGTNSERMGTGWFRQATSFMVLRPKLDADTAQAIADWADENMYNIPYSLFTGIFSAKNQADNPRDTQCAHLVWQAYMAFGYDIDSTGGPVVTPKNIANCDLFEVVQVNGFDLDKLWS